MKSKLLLLLSVIFLFSVSTVFSQESVIDFTTILSNAKEQSKLGNPYTAAFVRKGIEEGSVEIKLAFSGYEGPYKVEITPFLCEKNEEIRLETTTIETKSRIASNVLNTPTVLIPFEKDIYALEIVFSFADGSSPKIVIPFRKERATSAEIVAVKKD